MAQAHVGDDISGYLLGALDPGERERIAAHLASCARCAAQRAEDAQVLTALAGSVDDVRPGPGLRGRLIAAAGRDAARPRSLLPFRMDLRSDNPVLRWASLGVAAAFVIGLVGGVTGWALVLGDRLEKKGNELDASRNMLETLVHSDRVDTMEGSLNATPVHAALGLQSSGTGAVFAVSDLPAPSSGQGYHLWLFSNGTATLAGVWSPDARGDLVARLDEDLSRYDRLQLALEPLGSTSPGGIPVVSGALP